MTSWQWFVNCKTCNQPVVYIKPNLITRQKEKTQQVIPKEIWTCVTIYQDVQYDPFRIFDIDNGFVTIKENGIYSITASCSFELGKDLGKRILTCGLNRNEDYARLDFKTIFFEEFCTLQGTCVIQCNVDDFVCINVFHTAENDLTTIDLPQANRFACVKVGEVE